MNQLDKSQKSTQDNLSSAFTDLNTLMEKAADMVKLAETISSKLSLLKDSEMTKEIIQFRRNVMALGMPDPVTK